MYVYVRVCVVRVHVLCSCVCTRFTHVCTCVVYTHIRYVRVQVYVLPSLAQSPKTGKETGEVLCV